MNGREQMNIKSNCYRFRQIETLHDGIHSACISSEVLLVFLLFRSVRSTNFNRNDGLIECINKVFVYFVSRWRRKRGKLYSNQIFSLSPSLSFSLFFSTSLHLSFFLYFSHFDCNRLRKLFSVSSIFSIASFSSSPPPSLIFSLISSHLSLPTIDPKEMESKWL